MSAERITADVADDGAVTLHVGPNIALGFTADSWWSFVSVVLAARPIAERPHGL